MKTQTCKTICLLQQKGGVGKTTLSINLAAHGAMLGLRVLLVDADPQASALTWSSVRQEKSLFSVIALPTPNLHRELPVIAQHYDLVLIDAAPRVNELARSAILASDLILIPVQPSPFDVWASADTVKLISEARQFKPDIDAAFVINRKIANTIISRDVQNAFTDYPFPVFGAAITQRIIFAEAAAQGLSVVEIAPSSQAGIFYSQCLLPRTIRQFPLHFGSYFSQNVSWSQMPRRRSPGV